MSAGSRPASAIARSAASAPISRAVRPDAFVYSVSPMPTIATSPRTSSSSDAWPQSLTGARRYSLRHGEFGDGVRDVEHAARRGVRPGARSSPSSTTRRTVAGDAAGSRPCRSRTRRPGAARRSLGPRAPVDEVADRPLLALGHGRAEELGERRRRGVDGRLEARDRDRLRRPRRSSCSHSPRGRSRRGRSTRSARPRAARAAPTRRGRARLGPSRHRSATPPRRRSRGRRTCTAGPANRATTSTVPRTTPTDDRRAHRAVETRLREALVELGSDLRADFALRHLRNEHDLARVRGTRARTSARRARRTATSRR